MERLRWIFELVDKVSGPADTAARSLERVDATLKRTNTSSEQTQGVFMRMGSALSKMTFAILPTVVALGQIGGGLHAVINLFKAMGLSTASVKTGMAGLRDGAKNAMTSLRDLGAKGLAALKRIPPGVWAGVAALGAMYGAAKLAGAGIRAIKNAASGLMSMLGGPMAGLGVAFTAVAIAAGTAKGAIDAMISRDRQLRGLAILSGGNMEEAMRQRARFRDMADFLGMSPTDVANGMQELMTKGFSEVEAVRITQAGADLGAITPNFDPSRMILAMSQIRQAGVLQGDELNQLAESGLPLQHVYERIGAAMGVAASEVRGLRGTVPAAVAIQAILGGIQDTMGGDPLGTTAQQASQSLGGQLERLQQAPERFFASLADMSGPMSERIAGVVAQLNAFFDPATPESQAMMEGVLSAIEGTIAFIQSTAIPAIQDLFTWLRDPVTKVQMMLLWDTAKSFFSFMAGAVSTAMSMWNELSGFVGGFGGIVMHVLTAIGGAFDAWVLRPINALRTMFTTLTDLFTGNFTSWREMGGRLMDAFALGITDFAMAPINAISNVGGEIIDTARDVLGIHSPSRVFMELGEQTATGFAMGVDGGPKSMVGMPGIDGASLGAGAAGRFGGATITLNLSVDASGGDGRSIAESIRDVLIPELVGIFDATALEGGA